LIQEVSHLGAPEGPPAMEGKWMIYILSPKTQKGGKRPPKEATPEEGASAQA